MKKRIIKTIFLLAIFFAIPELAYAADYYASPSGSGSMCSQASPCVNPQTALNLAIVPGDRVYLNPGTYTLGASGLYFAAAGTAGNPITLTTAGAARSAIIDCANTNLDEECVGTSRGFVIIENLEVRNSGISGIKVDGDYRGTPSAADYGSNSGENYHPNGANNVIIRNNYVTGSRYDGIKVNHGDNHLVENNEIYRVSRYANPNTDRQQGIDMVGVYNSIIRGNIIHDDPVDPMMHSGMLIKGGSENVIVENNRVHHIYSTDPVGIDVGGQTEYYNIRYTASNFPNPYIGGRSVNEQCLFDDCMFTENPVYYRGDWLAEMRNAVVRGNIIHDVGLPITLKNAYNTKVYNNTFYNANSVGDANVGYGVMLQDDDVSMHTSENMSFYNNIWYNTTSSMVYGMFWNRCGDAWSETPPYTCDAGFDADYNAVWDGGAVITWTIGWHSGGSTGISNVTSNSLVGPDYRLQAGSPAIGAGVNLRTIGILGASETWTDRDGNARSTQTDIGALLYSSGGDGVAPSSPGGLSVM